MRPVVDLPQPDSPTSASVSPGATSKLRPSTARTVPHGALEDDAALHREVLGEARDGEQRRRS